MKCEKIKIVDNFRREYIFMKKLFCFENVISIISNFFYYFFKFY